MANPLTTFLSRLRPAAVSSLLLFILVFTATWLTHPKHSRFPLLPHWMEALVAAGICSLSVGIAVAVLTFYAEGKEHRIQEMLDRK
jgi:hypothetical protein